MARVRQSRSERPNQIAKARLAEIAANQWGVVSLAQLQEIGIGRAVLSAWVGEGRMHRVHPHVYAVGHSALGIEGRLAAALFYAGPRSGTLRCDGRLLARADTGDTDTDSRHDPPCLPVTGIGIGARPPQLKRILHKRLPVTPPAQTLLDIAERRCGFTSCAAPSPRPSTCGS